METYFFDTYAFFEVIKGNPGYDKFRQSKIVTTIVNLAELGFGIRQNYHTLDAETEVKKYAELVTEITIEDAIYATKTKIDNRKISLADALGYTVAKRLQIPFVTGDKEFKHMKNVEFVK
ncbi:MAG: PIN domain-containing protein [Candidatus Micrarchaeota archaeon]